MRTPAKLLLACAALLFCSTEASPQDELARIAKPWKKAISWVSNRRSLVEEVSSAEDAEEAAEEDEVMLKWTIVVGILMLAATFIGGYILESYHVTRLPEAGVGLIMGALAAGVAAYSGNAGVIEHARFDFEFFMVWLLPPIIFEAGYNMNVTAFVQNLGPTVFYAFVGTFASTFVVGGIVWYAGQLGWCYPLGLLAALTFGSLISATDPVTVLAVFQALGVKIDLFSMVFGESVLNDAVAIVLSRTLLSFNEPGAVVDRASIMDAVGMFTTIFVGSLVIGLVYGVSSALIFKKLNLKSHGDSLVFVEASLSFAFPWAAYYTSEAMELSGIVTILFCGMIMAIYTRNNFSPEAAVLTAQAYKCVAMIAETYVFVYLGMAAFTFPIFQNTTVMLIVVALGACFIGRLHIYVGSWLTNCLRKEGQTPPPISAAYMFVMWFSGLRGGVAFAIASVSYAKMDFPAHCGGLSADAAALNEQCTGMSDSLAILQTTLVIAAFTIFVFGGAITEVARHLKVVNPKGYKAPVEGPSEATEGFGAYNRDVLLPWLTHAKAGFRRSESGPRFDAVVVKPLADAQKVAVADAGPGPTTSEIKKNLSKGEVESALRGLSSTDEASTEDKLDELRVAFPGYTSAALKKLLQEAHGDLHQAIVQGQAKGF